MLKKLHPHHAEHMEELMMVGLSIITKGQESERK